MGMGIISMKEENIIKSSNDINIFYKKDIPNNPKGIVIIVHGFAEHLGRYDYFVDKLNQNGFGCYRFDNRGHGKSGGKSLDLEDYIDFAKDADLVVQKAKTEFPNLPIF
ncbi:MAG TPA: alpha/beta hydrolase, partial [Clostridiales bacterium]|nr:alpha/beta hydrolase [Clostridiales bacterium]